MKKQQELFSETVNAAREHLHTVPRGIGEVIVVIDGTGGSLVASPGTDMVDAAWHLVLAAAKFAGECEITDLAGMADCLRDTFFDEVTRIQESRNG